jgi:FixJ family two-component response regulator
MNAAPPGKRRVFIVDDEPEIRDALSLALSTVDVETEEYASAEGFWENAPHDEPYCVLLDNRLPGLSGVELLPRLVERSTLATVIIMTGHGDIPTAVQAMKQGAYHFVEKPFDPETLVGVVEEALNRAARESERFAERAGFRDRRATLTEREAEVFDLLVEGCATKTIAARLDITVRTAEHHRGAVLRKFEAKSISALMRMALARNED